jgi:hypothetical protein
MDETWQSPFASFSLNTNIASVGGKPVHVARVPVLDPTFGAFVPCRNRNDFARFAAIRDLGASVLGRRYLKRRLSFDDFQLADAPVGIIQSLFARILLALLEPDSDAGHAIALSNGKAALRLSRMDISSASHVEPWTAATNS